MKRVQSLNPGASFGFWTVVESAEPSPHGNARVKARCVCGAIRSVHASELRGGRTKSCGCMKGVLGSRARTRGYESSAAPTEADAAAAVGLVIDDIAFTATDVMRLREGTDAGEPDACWPWRRRPNRSGYGRLHVGGADGRRFMAHRVAFALANGGRLSSEEVVRHRCDNPICVNPRHLLPGTQGQNIQDAVERGRMASGARHGTHTRPERRATGERHPRHVLTAEQVRAIRAADVSRRGEVSRIARALGVARCTVADVLSGRRWGSVA